MNEATMTKRIIVLISLVFACVAEAKLNSCDMDAVYQVVTNRLLVQTRVSDAVTYAERLERRNGVSREMMTDALERAIKELHTDEETAYRANLRWMAVRLFSELAPQQRIEMLARLAETESNYCARTAFEGYYRRKTDSEGLALAARLLGRHKSPGVMRGAVWSVLSEEAEHELTEERQSQIRAFAERCLENADDVVDADRLLMKIYPSYGNSALRKSVRDRVAADRSGRYSSDAKRHFSAGARNDLDDGQLQRGWGK